MKSFIDMTEIDIINRIFDLSDANEGNFGVVSNTDETQ